MRDLDSFELQGEERHKALSEIDNQIENWGLKLPNVSALPLHFGLNKFREIGETEFWIANEQDQGYCGKFLFVFDGQTCPYHSHKIKHETFFVVKGSVRMIVNDKISVMNEGDVLAMQPGTYHSFTGIGSVLLLEVSMPSIRQDSFFADKNIGDEGIL